MAGILVRAFLKCFCVLFSLAVFLSVIPTKANEQIRSQKRVLLISLDGLDARYLIDADKYKLRIPTLRRLMTNGVTARGVVSVYPSITYPNHTSLVTGALPSKHGIFGNDAFESPITAERTGAGNWYARDIKAEALWDAAKRARLTVGMVSYPVSTGAGDWNIPEIWHPGGSAEQTRAVIAQNSLPKDIVAEIESKIPTLYAGTNEDEGDDARTRFAEYIITEKRPNLMLVHLFDLDHAEHAHGPFTPESFDILEKTDGYVARLLDALDRAGTASETTVFITSDHGFKPVSKQVNPGVLLRRVGLVTATETVDEKGKTHTAVTDWKSAVYVTGAACAIYLRDENDESSRKKILDIFKPLAGRAGSGIRRVLEPKYLRRIGSNTRAVIMLEAADGYTFGGAYAGEPITGTRTRGMHGYLPTSAEYYASFIASGAGVTRRGKIDYIKMTDVGVTVASALNIKLKDAIGSAVRLQAE